MGSPIIPPASLEKIWITTRNCCQSHPLKKRDLGDLETSERKEFMANAIDRAKIPNEHSLMDFIGVDRGQ
jgi:hypothetical protein